ncbi:hypothetical protein HPB49_003800 [Dermacentor silvarum]|uniref:Uncharacterized protein n=1 Tax=Dermacentor silvarum TaxID=543639 RepID=A0ACB8DMQ9_DERSI|nr:hypothetical protein HPB49_003800 [Dermacentor silvarum]
MLNNETTVQEEESFAYHENDDVAANVEEKATSVPAATATMMRRMREGDHGFFFKFYRMTPQMFDTLLAFVVTDLTSQNFIREPLEPAERLAIALRRCAENAFGITAARWRILLRTIPLRPKNVDFIIKAACILHNFLTVHNPQSHKFADAEDSFGNLITGQWRQGVPEASANSSEPHFFPVKATHCRNYLSDAAAARNIFAAYFCSSAGEVPWQWNLPGVSKEAAVKRLQEQILPTIH